MGDSTHGNRVLQEEGLDAMEHILQLLIRSLCLTIGLGVVTRREARGGSQGHACQTWEMGPTIRDNVGGNAMKAEYICGQEVDGRGSKRPWGSDL